MKNILMTVYGAEQKCASCVHLPSAKETYEWLVAAINRKYPNKEIAYEYIDFEQDIHQKAHEQYVAALQNDEYFYPLVTLNGEVVAEGNPSLKTIFASIEKVEN